MRRLTFATALIAVAALAPAAHAQASARAGVGITIEEPVGFGVVSDVFLPALPTVGGGAQVAPVVRNAALTIFGRTGDAVSMAVPTQFRVIRSGGTEALTVITNTDVEVGLDSSQVLLGGEVLAGSTMSVNVGGVLAVASSDHLVPGPYEGMMVVVVQYN
jgi:hypothetical protein